MPKLSVIVPMRDEAHRLRHHLPRLLSWCRDRHAELVLCDDGSRDGTLDLALELAQRSGLAARGLRLPRRGKGAAVKSGMRAAHGEVVAMVDADLPLPLVDLERVVAPVLAGASLSIGIRQRGSDRSGSGLSRRILSAASRWVSRAFLGGIEDSQCGCKAWSAGVARRLARGGGIDGFAFDVELLARSRDLGLTIAQVPVRWTHREGSSVRPLRDALAFLRDLSRLLSMRLRQAA